MFSGDASYEWVIVNDPKDWRDRFPLIYSVLYQVGVGMTVAGYYLIGAIREDKRHYVDERRG